MSLGNYTAETEFREINISYGRKRKQPNLRSASSVSTFLRRIVPNNSQEHFIAIYCNGSNEPIGFSIVSSGLANSCPVHPREVYQRAILLGASSVIVAHNHPTDNLEPSDEDKKVTRQLKDAAALLGLKLLDHIIFADKGQFSFCDEGLL
jgi:DNA repair protein RadC